MRTALRTSMILMMAMAVTSLIQAEPRDTPDGGGAPPKKIVSSVETAVHGRKIKVSATSVLKSQGKNSYGLKNLFDGRKDTAWIEGSWRFGEGDWLEVDLGRKEAIYGLRVIPGYAKNLKVLQRNPIPRFNISAGDQSFDTFVGLLGHEFIFPKSGPFKGEPVRRPIDRPEHFNDQYYMLPKPVEARSLKLAITGVWSEAGVDQDAGFSELRILTSGFMKKDTFAWFILGQMSGAKQLAKGAKLELPNLKQACPYANPVANKAKPWREATLKDLHALFKRHYSGVAMREGNVMLKPFLTRKEKNRYIVTIDHNLSDYCYSDGEGGTQFVPEYHLDPSGNIALIRAVARPWPVP